MIVVGSNGQPDSQAALAAANDPRSLDDLRVRYFGRKGGLAMTARDWFSR